MWGCERHAAKGRGRVWRRGRAMRAVEDSGEGEGISWDRTPGMLHA